MALVFYDVILFILLSPETGLRFGGLAGWLGLTGGRLGEVVVVVVVGAFVVVVVMGLRAGGGARWGTLGDECTRDPGLAEYPLGTLEYDAMKPSEVTLWSDTNWTRRTLLLVTMGLEMEGGEKQEENIDRD